jgi:transglutaminase-like putative cysteine protease
MIGALEYSLKDYTAVQRWITQDPKEGVKIKYPYLNLETLTLEENTSRITGTHKTIISGVKTSYYNVVTTGFDGLEVREKFGADGRPYRIVLGGVFECRLEPQSLATNIDRTINLFLRNTVSVNRPLGDSEKVALLKLSLDNTSGALLDNAPGQSVTPEPADDSVIVTINSKGIPYVNATKEEIKMNLAATIDIPANHPAIIGLAHNAIGDAGTNFEKLSRLVKFVYQYIEDDYTANPLTVMDIIEKKKGDCSEHAKLFTAMARAMGIPCRTVGGLVYLGDEFQELGLHAWNEVVIGGVWIPVDPTWGQVVLDATHIRFSVDISKEWEVMAVISKMKIEVLHVEHKK